MPETILDFRSDTVTRPTPAMRDAIATAEVGDDMTGEDPTVNRLEAMVAGMFGMESAVFACSGTQSNQMAVRAHCRPGDELLIAETGHIANFEAGAPAILSGVTCRTLSDQDGMIDIPNLEGKVRSNNQHLCRTRLVCLENTTNVGGGRAYPLEQVARIGHWAHEHDLKLHVDGARFFNASVAKGYSPLEFGQQIDSISLCFSKGLGCPMGSILVGTRELVTEARRSRKVFGGALRQAGIVAAAAVYALEYHIGRLADDHKNARLLADRLAAIDGIHIDPADVETNLVFFDIAAKLGNAGQLSTALKEQGVLINACGPLRLRACTHLDVDRDDVEQAANAIRDAVTAGFADRTGSTTGPYSRG